MKKFASMLLACLMFILPAAHAEIYTYDNTEEIMNGVQLRTLQRFLGDGWLNITAVTADLKSPHVRLDLLKSGNADKLATVQELAESQEGVIAAANADFFDNTHPSTSQGFSLGLEIKDSQLLQSQINEDMAAAFYDGASLALGYMTMQMTLTAPNGQSASIKHLNKHTSYYGDILMYTSDWNGGYSPAPGGEVVEMVVENDTVKEFRRNMPPVLIPENGYVLTVSEGANMFLANNLQPGDKAVLDITASPSIENIETAFGGGTMLLKDGNKTPFTHTINGRQPRTCIGTNADGTVVYIITVDGRQYASKGVTQSELADIALELGCVNAMNLDGGGSTRFMAKTFWNDELHVVNLPTENRKVINAVSVTTDADPGPAAGLRLKADADAVLLGDSVTLQSRFYDENGFAIWAYDEEPQWIIEGTEGRVEGNEFIPSSEGTAKITAVYKGTPSEPVYIKVIGQLSGISLPQRLELKPGESYVLYPEVFDRDGTTAYVKNISLLSPQLEGTAASINGPTITAVSDGYSVLRLSFGDVSSSMLIKAGSPSEPEPSLSANIIHDSLAGEILGGNSFSVFACTNVKPTLYSRLMYKNGLKRLSSSDSYGILGSYEASLLPEGMRTPIAANSFSTIDKGFALVISLPASGQLSGQNWINMANSLSTTSAENIIILTNTQPNGKTAEDTQVFYDYLDFISKSKNVFVVQPGRLNGVTVRGNTRFLTLADSAAYHNVPDSIANTYYLKFTMDGNECMYSFEPVF